MTRLNAVGADLAREEAVHAMTDVTGFGLLGHALEMARGAGLTVRLRAGDAPLLAQAESLARAGFVTGASHRNWASYGEAVALPPGFEDWRRLLLTDPQTSGGLLVACDAEAAPAILARIRKGDPRAAIVGAGGAGRAGDRGGVGGEPARAGVTWRAWKLAEESGSRTHPGQARRPTRI